MQPIAPELPITSGPPTAAGPPSPPRPFDPEGDAAASAAGTQASGASIGAAAAAGPDTAAKTGIAPRSGIGRAGATTDGDAADAPPETAGPAPAPDFLAALAEAAQPTATPEAVKAALAASGTAGAVGITAPPETAARPAAVPLGQVAMTIGLRSLAGSSQFEIRLDPAELGRVDVKLDIDKDRGTVTTHLVVERIDTLAMLQRDAGSLQQALSQAGLDPSEGGINLSLRGDGGARGETGQRDGQPNRGSALPRTTTEAAAAEAAPLRPLRGLGGLDIRI